MEKSIQYLLREARTKLGNNFSAALDSRLLLQAATGLTHTDIIAEPTRELSDEVGAKFNAFILRRLAHEPVSRILGRREFYGRDFVVTPDVLDPRPDTEVVVELALKHVRQGRFIDLGTGSGAIAITLCAEANVFSGLAADVSMAALDVARENAKRLGVDDRLSFHQGSWFEGVDEVFDLIVSNPPYIRDNEKLASDVMDYDPHLALFAGMDGLSAYREIARNAAAHLMPNGVVVVEIGHDQSAEVVGLFETQGFTCFDRATDLGEHVRGLVFKPHEPR